MNTDEWIMDGTTLWWLSIAISIGLVVALAAHRNGRARRAKSTAFDGDGARTPRTGVGEARPRDLQRWEDEGGALPVANTAAKQAGDSRR